MRGIERAAEKAGSFHIAPLAGAFALANGLDASAKLRHYAMGRAKMAEGIEAIGEVVTGGMAARAVEPAAGEHASEASSCLNCRTSLIGDYCHRFGQQATSTAR